MDSEQINALYQIGGAVSVVIVGAFFGIRWVIATVGALPKTTTKTEKTTIITGDTVAMEQLAKTLEASNVILTENNVLRREEHADRAAAREALEENTKAIERSTHQIVEARANLQALAIELARAGK